MVFLSMLKVSFVFIAPSCTYESTIISRIVKAGRDELPIPVKVGFDEYYLKNRTLLLDLKIILLTAKKVILVSDSLRARRQ